MNCLWMRACAALLTLPVLAGCAGNYADEQLAAEGRSIDAMVVRSAGCPKTYDPQDIRGMLQAAIDEIAQHESVALVQTNFLGNQTRLSENARNMMKRSQAAQRLDTSGLKICSDGALEPRPTSMQANNSPMAVIVATLSYQGSETIITIHPIVDQKSGIVERFDPYIIQKQRGVMVMGTTKSGYPRTFDMRVVYGL